jgi:endoglucanase
MEEKRVEFLRQMIAAPSPSGFEQPVQAVIGKEMKKYADKVQTDVMGNTVGLLNPKGSPRIMLAGHCDEIGFMIRHITDEGYIYIAPIGGIDTQVMNCQRVVIHNAKGPVFGVVGRKAIHLMSGEDHKKVAEIHDLWIDIGAKNKKDALTRVSIADPITFAVGLDRLGGDLVVARGLDDKMGAFVVVEVLRLLAKAKIKAAVCGVSTVQEELGLRGAKTSAFGLDPELAIAIDVTHASDHPGTEKTKSGDIKLGKGPVLHRGANINPVIADLLVKTAEAEKIPYQMLAAPAATGTDANAIQLSRTGVATALVAVALRYMHTPAEVLSLDDLENAAKLIAAFIKRLKPGMSFLPG